MARNKQLSQLVTDLKHEVGHSSAANLGQSVLSGLKNRLERVQEKLWEDYDWPFLRIHQTVQMQAGSRYYDLPSNIILERVERVRLFQDGQWRPVGRGIDYSHYNQYDPVLDERGTRVTRWQAHTDGQFEVWPLPDANGVEATQENMLRITGIRNLGALIAEDDTADLDDRLIVLHAAAEMLKGAEAQIMAAAAVTHYNRLKGRLQGTKEFNLNPEQEYAGIATVNAEYQA